MSKDMLNPKKKTHLIVCPDLGVFQEFVRTVAKVTDSIRIFHSNEVVTVKDVTYHCLDDPKKFISDRFKGCDNIKITFMKTKDMCNFMIKIWMDNLLPILPHMEITEDECFVQGYYRAWAEQQKKIDRMKNEISNLVEEVKRARSINNS